MNILLTEDDVTIRPMLAALLKLNGHEVVAVECGEDALKVMGSGQLFDMVISDLDMKVVTGFEVMEAAREKIPQARRLLMSGRMVDDLLPRAMASGAEYAFFKPDFMKAFKENNLLRKQPVLAT